MTKMPPTQRLWPHSNNTFVSKPELLISIYVRPGVSLSLRAGAGQVHKQSIFEPGEPQCANACGFFNGGCAQQKQIETTPAPGEH
jgi:hypothetical protein